MRKKKGDGLASVCRERALGGPVGGLNDQQGTEPPEREGEGLEREGEG